MPTVEAFADVEAAIGPAAEAFAPLAQGLISEHFPGCRLGGIGLFVLDPGQIHPVHTDVQPPEFVTRVHVPLATNPHAVATMEDGPPLHLAVGKAYKFDTRLPHAVANGGKTPRVHLVFEVLR